MASNMNKKKERIEANKDKRPYAKAKYLRLSPYKVRTVLALIRGKSVDEAEAILTYCDKGGSAEVKKVLLSAAANAEHNQGMDRAIYTSQRLLPTAVPTSKECSPFPREGVTRF